MSRGKRVFVSYVRENTTTVRKLVDELRSRGATVFFDQDDLPPGVVWADAIARAISTRDYFIACFSREYSARVRTHMNEELEQAFGEIRLRSNSSWFIPILLSGDIPDIQISPRRHLRDFQFTRVDDTCWGAGVNAIARTIGASAPELQRATRLPGAKGAKTGTSRYRLAKQFVQGLRAADLRGPSLAVSFDYDEMQLTRDLLVPSDVPLLMNVIADRCIDPGIRNRCASLVLSDNCITDDNSKRRIAYELIDLYTLTIGEFPAAWEVPRAIALALSNRLGYETCILDYLHRILPDEAMVQANLRQTDTYYGGSAVAIRNYKRRLPKTSPTAFVWELFYLSHRVPTAKAHSILKLIRRQLDLITSPDLRVFWCVHVERLSEH